MRIPRFETMAAIRLALARRGCFVVHHLLRRRNHNRRRNRGRRFCGLSNENDDVHSHVHDHDHDHDRSHVHEERKISFYHHDETETETFRNYDENRKDSAHRRNSRQHCSIVFDSYDIYSPHRYRYRHQHGLRSVLFLFYYYYRRADLCIDCYYFCCRRSSTYLAVASDHRVDIDHRFSCYLYRRSRSNRPVAWNNKYRYCHRYHHDHQHDCCDDCRHLDLCVHQLSHK
mmetsp:Transcript_19577/g.42584  ORF Transcript_19577/g.42584 Transcript_19577/m.42584 type:complete len:229 (-) Transcript_19577:679-1365(-)